LILIIFISFSLIKEFLRKLEINREVNELEAEVSLLEERNTKMADLIQYLNSSSWQEKEVKSRLNLQSPGEKVVLIPENNQTNINVPEQLESSRQVTEEKISNPQKWLNYFLAN
jgi:cell division protein FtsB